MKESTAGQDTPAPQILTYYTPEGAAYNAGSARPDHGGSTVPFVTAAVPLEGVGRTDAFDALIGPTRRVEGITR